MPADPYEGWRWKLKTWWIGILDLVQGRLTLWRWRVEQRHWKKEINPARKSADIIEIQEWKRRKTPTTTNQDLGPFV